MILINIVKTGYKIRIILTSTSKQCRPYHSAMAFQGKNYKI